MSAKRERYPENAPGPFYVEKDLCLICRAPEAEAPGLMGFIEDESGGGAKSHCYFKKQPGTPEEISHAIDAIGASCCGALRYDGEDQETLARLIEMGKAEDCDADFLRTDKCNTIKLFRVIGSLEAISFLLLMGVGMPLKYMAGMPSANRGLGWAHGILFGAFCVCLAVLIRKYSISKKVAIVGFVAALVPFGPFLFHPYLTKYLDNREERAI